MTYSYNNSILGDYLTPSGNNLIVENPIIINSGSINNTIIGNTNPASGNFTNLSVNGITVSVSGHSHTSSNITDFNSSVSGLLTPYQLLLTNPVTGTGIVNHIPYWGSTSGLLSDSNQLIWDSTNNRLGIGVTSPQDLIHISGSSLSIAGIRFDNSSGHGGGVGAANGMLYLNSSTSTACRLSGRKIRLGDGGVSACAIELTNVGSISQHGNGGGLTFNDTNASFSNGLNVISGNVGIGTASPSGQLNVIGESRMQGVLYFNQNSTDANDSSRNRCSIQRATGQNLTLAGGSNTIQLAGDGGKIIIRSSTVGTEIGGDGANSYVMFNPGGSEKARITPSGWLGIGTATPSSQLHVIGTGIFSENLLVNGTGVSLQGHTHTSSQITDFNSSVSGLLPTISNSGDNRLLTSTGSSVGIDAESNLTFDGSTFNIDGNLTFDTFTESLISIGNSSSGVVLSIGSGTVQTCTLTNSCTFTMPTATAGKSFTMFLNTGSGNFTASFSGVLWSDSSPPTITATSNKVDILSFISDGNYWYGSYSQNYG